MKRIILSLLIVFALITFFISDAFSLSFDPSNYTFLAVTSPYSSPALYFPTINNSGEIVGVNANVGGIGGHNQLVSTVRGALPLSTSYVYNNISFTDINDSGEVVYAGLDGSGGYKIYSTARGYIDQGNGPGINNLGEVSYSFDPNWPKKILSNVRGTVMQYDQSTGVSVSTTDINDSGEIVATISSGPPSTSKIVSSVRGELANGFHPSINNYGDVIYHDANTGFLFSLDGTQITNYLIGAPDMNDFGDIVFEAESFYDYYVNTGRPIGGDIPITDWEAGIESEYTVLATQNPDRYTQYPAFHYVKAGNVTPEPATLLLFGSGLVGLAGFGRKRFKK